MKLFAKEGVFCLYFMLTLYIFMEGELFIVVRSGANSLKER